MKKLLFSTAAAVSLMAETTELETLKTQMVHMQQTLQSMHEKINALESSNAQETPPSEILPLTGPNNGTLSNLDFSLILDTSYVNRSQKEERLSALNTPGFVKSPLSESPYNPSNGFNLNYAEVALHSVVDPYLDADVVFHVAEGGVEIEEGYLTSRNLPYNLRIRGGKLLSEFGRINAQHHHAWNFSDLPLVYRSFLGHEKLKENGVQFQWIAPTEPYLMFGIEALQGSNYASFGTTPITNSYDGSTLASSPAKPSLIVGYAKTSMDIAESTLLAGASVVRGESRIDFADSDPAFSGKSTLYGVDFTLKHYFDSYSSLSWQSEWLYRTMEGRQFSDNGSALLDELSGRKQAGFYTELVYAPDQTWRFGTRYDSIYHNALSVEGVDRHLPGSMEQISAMIEYHTSEFARYRFEYAHSNALFTTAGERQPLDSFIFSVNLAIGKHTAHSF
ncbi:MAG: hypothetical protein M0P91_09640 [Sulfuricurvum sp.]|jgi:hypothetical protein|uniref:hypothetical protein n=1 Tax=Sulfuricurvum sp. TaxID=2025608 RepID=UPI0025F5F912|nr:hypothetical protein [Sulfuricurvum sp.]MCK9373450.1 hypothetical protein [Sulfuricurvum sp.]